MRVIFMGNPEFSIPTIKAIQNSRHDLLAIVSNPPKPIGRNRLLHLSPVGKYAREKEIPLIEAPTVNSEILKTQLADLYPDIFIVVAYKAENGSVFAWSSGSFALLLLPLATVSLVVSLL